MFMIKSIFRYLRVFLLSFLISWFMLDIWHLSQGDMRPLKRKGVQVEWLIHSSQELLSDTEFGFHNERSQYIGVRITYTYVSPILHDGIDSNNQ